MSNSDDREKTVVENINSVNMGDLVIKTWLSTGYDSDTADEHRRDVLLTFKGFDELTGDRFEKFVKEIIAGKLRIKVNSPSSPYLKSNPKVYDSESLATYIDAQDGELEFEVSELFTPTKRSLTPREEYLKSINRMYNEGQIDEEKRDQLAALAPEEE